MQASTSVAQSSAPASSIVASVDEGQQDGTGSALRRRSGYVFVSRGLYLSPLSDDHRLVHVGGGGEGRVLPWLSVGGEVGAGGIGEEVVFWMYSAHTTSVPDRLVFGHGQFVPFVSSGLSAMWIGLTEAQWHVGAGVNVWSHGMKVYV
jgi:hypothetical protein